MYPFKVLSPLPLPEGNVNIRLGISSAYHDHLLFQAEDKQRNVTELPSLSATIAVGPNTELFFRYPFLYLDQKGQDGNYGSGDVEIYGLFNIFGSREWRIPMALKVGVKLPNADDEREYGTDQTDFFFGFAAAHSIGRFINVLNIDLGILGHPRGTATEQDDVLRFDWLAGYELGDGALVGLALEGVGFSRYGNDRLLLRSGARFPWGKFNIDLGAGYGLSGQAPEWVINGGISVQFGAPITVTCLLPTKSSE
jgi:hypothetical protein